MEKKAPAGIRFRCVGIQGHIGNVSGQILIIGLGTDHGAIVPAELQRRHIDLSPQLFRCGQNVPPNPGIGRHTACNGDFLAAGLPDSKLYPGHQSVGYRRREGGAQVRNTDLLPQLLGVVDQVQGGSLET